MLPSVQPMMWSSTVDETTSEYEDLQSVKVMIVELLTTNVKDG